MGTGSGRLTKAEFSEFLGTVWHKSMEQENIISRFKTTGIFPVYSSKFPVNEFTGNVVECPSQGKEEILPTNMSHLSSASQVDIPSCSQAIACEIDISDQLVTVQDRLGEIDRSEEPSTSYVTTQMMIDSQATEQTAEISILPSSSQIALESIDFPTSSVTTEMGTLFFKKPALDVVPQKTISIRLKRRSYGEVVTTEQVLQRLKEAENKKQLKRKDVKVRNKRVKTMKENKLIFKGGKRGTTTYKYVCLIEHIEGTDLEVMGLKSIDTSKQDFSVVEKDKSYISFEQVIGLLPFPEIRIKGEQVFLSFYEDSTCYRTVIL
ncbi:hypothetical protein FQR65_LT15067 [Abscondita terminalis]|nr:hypothetical protein FQR65_LT15067 [Abscondita terminalis]